MGVGSIKGRGQQESRVRDMGGSDSLCHSLPPPPLNQNSLALPNPRNPSNAHNPDNPCNPDNPRNPDSSRNPYNPDNPHNPDSAHNPDNSQVAQAPLGTVNMTTGRGILRHWILWGKFMAGFLWPFSWAPSLECPTLSLFIRRRILRS